MLTWQLMEFDDGDHAHDIAENQDIARARCVRLS